MLRFDKVSCFLYFFYKKSEIEVKMMSMKQYTRTRLTQWCVTQCVVGNFQDVKIIGPPSREYKMHDVVGLCFCSIMQVNNLYDHSVKRSVQL